VELNNKEEKYGRTQGLM